MTTYRTGRRLGRTVYRQVGTAPSDSDVLLGLMDTPELGRQVADTLTWFDGCSWEYGVLTQWLEGDEFVVCDDLAAAESRLAQMDPRTRGASRVVRRPIGRWL